MGTPWKSIHSRQHLRLGWLRPHTLRTLRAPESACPPGAGRGLITPQGSVGAGITSWVTDQEGSCGPAGPAHRCLPGPSSLVSGTPNVT